MAGLPPFISFSTSYPELNSAVLRPTGNERFVGYSELDSAGLCNHCPVTRDPAGKPGLTRPQQECANLFYVII